MASRWTHAGWLPLVIACAGRNPAQGSAHPPPVVGQVRAPERAAVLPDAEWGLVHLDDPALELRLPEVSAWRLIEGGGGTWVRIEHPESESRIELWQTRAERRVRPRDCEAKARLRRPDLWRPIPETILERQSLDIPVGYRSDVTVGIDSQGGRTVEGFVTAFGATASRCLVFSFSTRAHGRGADSEIGRRLNLVRAGILPSLSPRAVEDRLLKEHPR